MQTPQGFRRQVLADAHERGAQLAATDDAALAENLGVRVVAVPGSDASFKVTTQADLVRAEAFARSADLRGPQAAPGETS
jgi:2-C-methyl-D-erythritol 4-phosphate cytidylyltransferase